MNGQAEREYWQALDGLRFSQEEKERIMNHLMEQQNQEEKRPVKGKRLRPLRAALVAAAVCAALVGTAGAATFVARQARINFFDSHEEAVEAARRDNPGVDNGVCGVVTQDLKDYDEMESLNMDDMWNGEPGVTLVEDADGTQADGWTAKRVFQYEWDGKTYLKSRYKAEAPSGYDGLWNGWDTSWLEEHYTPTAGQTLFEQVETEGRPYQAFVLSEFRGQDDTVFNIQYTWMDRVYGDQYFLGDGLDHHEVYTTADGVEATIMTATSHSGKTVFWVDAIFGHGSFSMFGNEVEMNELYTILDSLNLSAMLEYAD